jgi:hypothetical protein
LPPTYEEFTRDPLPNYQLTPNDLRNLGRLVVLEATSMYVHASDELYDSPAGRQLIDDITGVWIAADAFTAAVWFDPGDPRIAEAGMLSLPDLQAAYERLRATMQIVPGRAQVTALNFRNMSRVMSVIGPIIREASAELAAVEAPVTSSEEADLGNRSAALTSAIESLSKTLAQVPEGSNLPGRLKDQIKLLGQLARGFDSVLGEGPDDRDAAAAFRPLRTLATRTDGEISNSRFPAAIRDGWSNVRSQVDELADVFQLPREIAVSPPPHEQATADEATIKAIDQALRDLVPTSVPGAAATANLVAPAAVADDARGLRMRLLLLRQQLLGREANWRIARSARGVEAARRRLGDRLNLPTREKGPYAQEKLRKVDEAVALVRNHLSGAR